MKKLEYKWLLLIVVMIGTMMSALDASIVNVSIPSIMADFGVGVDDIEWIVTGYMLAFAVLMPVTSWLRDHIGHKKLYIGSLTVFTIASILCGFAWNLPSLIFMRVLQALGGGAITPTAMAMISESFEPRERGKAMGFWGMGLILGPSIGPTLGGILTKYFGWRSIFFINIPIGIVGIIMAIYMLRRDVPHAENRRKFDIGGFVFLTIFLISLLLGLTNGEKEGWTSHYVVTCAILSFFSFIGFLTVESLVPDGIMDIRLFKIPVFTIAAFVNVVRSISLFGGVFLLPVFLQREMGLDEIQSGLVLLPGALVISAIMPFGGKLADTIGARLPTVVGLFGIGFSMYLYKDLDSTTSLWGVIYPTLIRGIGLGLLMAPVGAAAMNSVPHRKVAASSSMLSLIQQVAGSIGIAILTTVLSHRTKYHMTIGSTAMMSDSVALKDIMKNTAAHAHSLGYTHIQSFMIGKMMIIKELFRNATVRGFQDAFIVTTIITALAFVPAFFLPGLGFRKKTVKETKSHHEGLAYE